MAFKDLEKQIRIERRRDREVPGFDPANGNEAARYLFLLEAPGAKAVRTGLISPDNSYPTALNCKAQIKLARIEAKDIALWNVVPWYLGGDQGKRIQSATFTDVRAGLNYLVPPIEAMPTLQCVVLVGGAARKAHVFLSRLTTVKILSCHHPSAQAMNANPAAAEENVNVLRFMKATTETRSKKNGAPQKSG